VDTGDISFILISGSIGYANDARPSVVLCRHGALQECSWNDYAEFHNHSSYNT